MPAVQLVDAASDWARRLEDDVARRRGITVAEARAVVARDTLVPAGTLENLRKRRLKNLGVYAYQQIKSALIRQLQSELRALEHEIHVLRATGVDPRSDEMAEAIAGLQKVREALGIEG
jgi:hypothetical protein